jgi:hypothetical protein
MINPRTPAPLAERFERMTCPEPNTGCLLWTGALYPNGYGHMGTGSRKDGTLKGELAHRVAWRLKRGPIPRGKCVLHKCDTRPCVEEAHLFIGTKSDNTQDMIAKGRMKIGARATGADHHQAVLTTELVIEIRRARQSGEGRRAIARRLGVSHGAVAHVDRGTTWRHVL